MFELPRTLHFCPMKPIAFHVDCLHGTRRGMCSSVHLPPIHFGDATWCHQCCCALALNEPNSFFIFVQVRSNTLTNLAAPVMRACVDQCIFFPITLVVSLGTINDSLHFQQMNQIHFSHLCECSKLLDKFCSTSDVQATTPCVHLAQSVLLCTLIH